MLHAVLYGEHELTIDDKNRLLVPAEIRKSLSPERDGEAFFLVIGRNRKPWLYPERYYEHLVSLGQFGCDKVWAVVDRTIEYC